MDHVPQRRRHPRPARRLGLGVLWVIALVAAASLVEDSQVIDDAFSAMGRRLRAAAWVWPLAAVVAVTVATSPLVRNRWRRPTSLQLGLIIFFGLGGLIVAVGPLQALLVLAPAAIVGLLAVWALVLPRRLAPPLPAETLDRLGDRDRLEATDARVKLQNDLRATALQAIAGLAVLVGAVLAFQQLTNDRQQATATQELTRQGQTSERFTRAIDQLGSDRLEVQLGGIYGLEQIAQQAPDNRPAVTQVLVAYLHRRSPRPANTTQPAKPLRVRAPDVQAALTVLGRRWPVSDADPPLDLSNLDLRGAIIRAAYIIVDPAARPELGKANLNGADLRDTDLRGASFVAVELAGAHFDGADLRGANLEYADWPGLHAQHPDAELKDADLRGALADGSTRWPEGFDWRAEGVEMT